MDRSGGGIVFTFGFFVLVLVALLAGCDAGTGSAIGALAGAAGVGLVAYLTRRRPPVDMERHRDEVNAADAREREKRAAARRVAEAEQARIAAHRAAENERPAVDRAQDLIDRNRTR